MSENNIKIKTLEVGDGEVRVRIDIGYSKEVDNVWIKPGFSIEVPVPDYADTPTALNSYINKELLVYATHEFQRIVARTKRLAGVK